VPSPKPIPIFDGHNDVLLRLRLHLRGGAEPVTAFLNGEDKGHLDLPKAHAGGFAGGLFAVFVPSPKRKERPASEATPQTAGGIIGSDPEPPPLDIAEAQRVTFAMAALLFRIERESQGRLRVCRDAGDIERCLADDVLAAVLHIEAARR
jgi:membrane dipeptidase